MQAGSKRCCETHARSYATIRRTLNGLVLFPCVAPECFIAERIKAKVWRRCWIVTADSSAFAAVIVPMR
jgi:hypothetical protein